MSQKLEQAIRDLRSMPGMGHRRADVRKPAFRFWLVKPYVIAYRYDDKTLTLVRVLHGQRDFRGLFGRL